MEKPNHVPSIKVDRMALDPNVIDRAGEAFRELDHNMSFTAAAILMEVARRGIVSQKDLELRLGLTRSTASRYVAYWTDTDWKGNPSHGFVKKEPDPTDNRYHLLTLTKKGRNWFEKHFRTVKDPTHGSQAR